MYTTPEALDLHLAELAALEPGWHDGSGVTPSPAALATARTVALTYQSLGRAVGVCALPDEGGVCVECDEGTVEVNQAGAVALAVHAPPQATDAPSARFTLTDEELASILAHMRTDRLARGGRPAPAAAPRDELDLDAIQARADAAYPGPWRVGTVEKEGKVWGRDPDALGGPSVGEHCLFSANTFYSHTDNRVFVAHARTDVPALVKALRAAREEIARLAPRQRAGQLLFNALAEVDPAFAERIRGTELDPFHRDGGIAQACIDAEAVVRGERPRPVPTPVVCRDCAAPVDVLCDVCGTGRCSAHGAAAVCDDCEACDLRPVVRGIAARDAERTASRLCAIFTALGLAPATRPMDDDGIPAGGAAVTAGACEVWVGADGSLGAVLRLDAPATDATP